MLRQLETSQQLINVLLEVIHVIDKNNSQKLDNLFLHLNVELILLIEIIRPSYSQKKEPFTESPKKNL